MTYDINYYRANRRRILDQQKVWRENNREATLEAQRRWKEANEGHTYLDQSSGYVRYIGYQHPAATPSGITNYHRIVLWDKLSGMNAPCHWCGMFLFWDKPYTAIDVLVADHVNTVKNDNRPENLVPSCKRCNLTRENGQVRQTREFAKDKDCHLDFCDRKAVSHWDNEPVCGTHYNQAWAGKEYKPIRTHRRTEHNEKGRVCTGCDTFKTWDEFYDRSCKTMKQSKCKVCMASRVQERMQEMAAAGIGCSEPNCTNPATTKGMCQPHYHKAWYAIRKARAEATGGSK